MTEIETTRPNIDKFVDEMLSHAYELHGVLRKEGDKNHIKDRITCLKYLEEVAKTYFVLKKVSLDESDSAAAGSAVRKYAGAFAKNGPGIGEAPKRRGRPPKSITAVFDADGGDGDAERMRRIRSARPDARLVVDANEAWSERDLAGLMAVAAACGIETIEQPLKPIGNGLGGDRVIDRLQLLGDILVGFLGRGANRRARRRGLP